MSTASTTTTTTSTNQSRRRPKLEVAEAAAASNVEIGDHVVFVVTASGIDLYWGDGRRGSFECRFAAAHSVLIEFAADEFAQIGRAQFFSCSLLKQMPTFLELKLFMANLDEFEPDDLQDRLREVCVRWNCVFEVVCSGSDGMVHHGGMFGVEVVFKSFSDFYSFKLVSNEIMWSVFNLSVWSRISLYFLKMLDHLM